MTEQALAPRTARLQRDPRIRPALLIVAGALVVVALIVLALVSPGPALPTRLQDGLTLSISVLIESMPFVILGVLLSIVVQVWVPPGMIERWMPRRAWARDRRSVAATDHDPHHVAALPADG